MDRCAWHKPLGLPYLAAQADADRRIRRGQKQFRCSVCERWYWGVERGKRPKGIEQSWQTEDDADYA